MKIEIHKEHEYNSYFLVDTIHKQLSVIYQVLKVRYDARANKRKAVYSICTHTLYSHYLSFVKLKIIVMTRQKLNAETKMTMQSIKYVLLVIQNLLLFMKRV